MVEKTLQIATFGDDPVGIQSGLRNFPVHKLVLLYFEEDRKKAEAFQKQILDTLGISVSKILIKMPDVIRSALESVAQIINEYGKDYDQILVNVSAGNKMMGCAAISSAFVNGLMAFDTDMSGNPVLLPILKLSYNEMISDSKIKILQAIREAGGEVKSLEQISKLTGFGKPLLSYHIQGSNDAKGLVQLGLVDSEKLDRGKSKITLNTLGAMLITNLPMEQL